MRVVFPYYYLPMLLFTTLLIIGSMLVTQDLKSGNIVHGRVNRCDFNASCSLEQRSNFDTTWLCCEDGTFWPATHIISPMSLMILLGDPYLTGFLAFSWEAIEADALTYIGSFVVYPTTLDQLETASGSLVADAQIQGVLGILLASLIMSYSGFPGVIPLIIEYRDGEQRWTGHRMRSKGVIWKYFGLFVLLGIIFIYAGQSTLGGFVYGPILTMLSLSILLLLLFPLWIRHDDAIGVDMHVTYRRTIPLWWISSMLIAFSSIGFHFLANDFYQSWLMYFIATLFVIIWIRRSPERIDSNRGD